MKTDCGPNQPSYSHRAECRVIYGDTDSMGIAYHANYFRWFETGRAELFRSIGAPYAWIEEKGYFLPITEAFCKYIAPIKYDDLLWVETVVDTSIRAGIKFNYRIFKNGRDESRIAEGYTRHAFLDRTGKVVRPPKFITELVDRYFGRLSEMDGKEENKGGAGKRG